MVVPQLFLTNQSALFPNIIPSYATPKIVYDNGPRSISIRRAWSSLVEGGEGLYLPNCQTTLVIALDALSLLFCIFVNSTAYHLGRHEPSPPSTKELHGYPDSREYQADQAGYHSLLPIRPAHKKKGQTSVTRFGEFSPL